MANQQIQVDLMFNADTKSAQANLETLKRSLKEISSIIPPSGTQLNSDIKKATESAKALSQHLSNAFNVKTGNIDLTKLETSLKASGQSLSGLSSNLLKAGMTGETAFISMQRAISNSNVQISKAQGLMANLATTMKNTIKWQLSSSLMHGFMGSIQQAWGYVKSLDSSLNNIRIVTGYSADEMATFAEEANKAAKALSTTTTGYTDAALIFYQQGIRDADAIKERVEVTTKLANVSRQSMSDVSDQMTAVWNNFDDGTKSLEYYADVLTALGAATASSTQEITTGLEKFAAVADTVGLSYEYASAALATVTATTRQSAEVVGTAFKTLFARIQSLKLGETLEDDVTLGQYSSALNTIGVNILNANGELKDMDNILEETAAKWQNLSKAQQVSLAQTVAGVRQYSQFIALMDNWDFMQENIETANSAMGTLQGQQDIYAESWSAAAKRVKASLETIYQELIPEGAGADLTNAFAGILDVIGDVVGGMGGIKTILLLVASIVTTKFAPEIANGIQTAFDKISNLKVNITGIGERFEQSKNSVSNFRSALNEIAGSSGMPSAIKQAEIFETTLKGGTSEIERQQMASLKQADATFNVTAGFKAQVGILAQTNNLQTLINQNARLFTEEEKSKISMLQQELLSHADIVSSTQQELENLKLQKEELTNISSYSDSFNDGNLKLVSENDNDSVTVVTKNAVGQSQDLTKSVLASVDAGKQLYNTVSGVDGKIKLTYGSFEALNKMQDLFGQKLHEAGTAQATINQLVGDANTETSSLVASDSSRNEKLKEITKQLLEQKGVLGKDITAELQSILKAGNFCSENTEIIKSATIQWVSALTKASSVAGISKDTIKEILSNAQAIVSATHKGAAAQTQYQNSLSKVKSMLEIIAGKPITASWGLAQAISGISTLGMSISSVANAFKTLGDSGASSLQKITAATMALSMGFRGISVVAELVGGTIRSISNFKGAKTVAQMGGAEEVAAQVAEAKAAAEAANAAKLAAHKEYLAKKAAMNEAYQAQNEAKQAQNEAKQAQNEAKQAQEATKKRLANQKEIEDLNKKQDKLQEEHNDYSEDYVKNSKKIESLEAENTAIEQNIGIMTEEEAQEKVNIATGKASEAESASKAAATNLETAETELKIAATNLDTKTEEANTAGKKAGKLAELELIKSKIADIAATMGLDVASKSLLGTILTIAAPFLALAAVIGAIIYIIKQSIDAYNADAQAMENAKEASENLKNQLSDLKNEVSQVKSTFDEYQDLINTLNSCTKGTLEWKEALSNVNEKTSEILAQYSELLQYANLFNDDGTINKDALDQFYANKQNQLDNLNAANLMAQANLTYKTAKSNETDFSRTSNAISAVTEFYSPKAQSMGYYGERTLKLANEEQVTLNRVSNQNDDIKALSEQYKQTGILQSLDDITQFITGLDDIYYGDLTKEQQEYISSIRDLVSEYGNAETAIDNATKAIIDQYNAQNDIEASREKDSITGKLYEQEVKRIEDDVITELKSFAQWRGSPEKVEDIWERYQAATGEKGQLYKNAIQGNQNNRTIWYVPEGKDTAEKLTVDQIATAIAASEALQNLGASANEASKILSNIKPEIEVTVDVENNNESKDFNYSSDIIKSYISDGNFENASVSEYNNFKDALQTKYGENLENINLSTDENKDEFASFFGQTKEEMENFLTLTGQTWESFVEGLKSDIEFDPSSISNNISQYLREGFNSAFQGTKMKASDLKAVAEQIQQTFVSSGKDAANSIQSMFKDLDTKGMADEFLDVTNDITDWNAISLSELKTRLEAANVSTAGLDEELQIYIDSMRAGANATVDLASAQSKYKTAIDAVKELDLGDAIELDKFKEALGDNAEEIYGGYFTTMADGTLKLTRDAEAFYNLVKQNKIEEFKTGATNELDKYNVLNNIQQYLNEDGEIQKVLTMPAYVGEDVNTFRASQQLDLIKALELATDEEIADYQYALDSGKLTIDQATEMAQLVKNADYSTENLTNKLNERREAADEFAQSWINSSENLAEFDNNLKSVLELYVSKGINEADYSIVSDGLIVLASNYENCANEIANYQSAISSNSAEQIKNTEKVLRASIRCGELAKKYNLAAEEIEYYTQALKNNNKYSNLSDTQLVELAAHQLRYDKQLSNSRENIQGWISAIKNANSAGQILAYTVGEELAEAYGAVLNIDGSELSQSFIQSEQAAELLNTILNGTQEEAQNAYQELQQLYLNDYFTSIGIDIDDRAFTAKIDAIKGILEDTFNDSNEDFIITPEMDTAGILNSIATLINSLGMGKDAAVEFLDNLGYDAEVVEDSDTVKETIGYSQNPRMDIKWLGSYTDEATGGTINVKAPYITYDPEPVTVEKAVSGSALKITSLSKKSSSGGNIDFSGNTYTPPSTSGGGSSYKPTSGTLVSSKSIKKSSSTDAKIKSLENDKAKIDKALDYATGSQKIELLNKQLEIQEDINEEKKKTLQYSLDDLKANRQILEEQGKYQYVDENNQLQTKTYSIEETIGVTFKFDSYGNITNMAEVEEAFNEYETQLSIQKANELNVAQDNEELTEEIENRYKVEEECLAAMREDYQAYLDSLEEVITKNNDLIDAYYLELDAIQQIAQARLDAIESAREYSKEIRDIETELYKWELEHGDAATKERAKANLEESVEQAKADAQADIAQYENEAKSNKEKAIIAAKRAGINEATISQIQKDEYDAAIASIGNEEDALKNEIKTTLYAKLKDNSLTAEERNTINNLLANLELGTGAFVTSANSLTKSEQALVGSYIMTSAETLKEMDQVQSYVKAAGDSEVKAAEAYKKWYEALDAEEEFNKLLEEEEKVYRNYDRLNNKYELTSDNIYKMVDNFELLTESIRLNQIASEDYLDTITKENDINNVSASELKSTLDSLRTYYTDSLSSSLEQIAKYTTHMDNMNSALEHYLNILKLLGREKDYVSNIKILEGIETSTKNAYDLNKAEYEMLKSQVDQLSIDLAAATGEEEKKILQDTYDEAVAKMDEAGEKMYSSAEEYGEAAKNVLLKKIEQTFDELENQLTNGQSWESLDMTISGLTSHQEEYLTQTNKVYEVNKMLNNLNKDIQNTTNKTAKDRYSAFSKEIEQLKSKGELSNIELKIAQQKYKILQAQIALEEAQNAKSVVRLRKDSNGNYGYVYTADQNKINDAQQSLEDAKNELYNIQLEATNQYGEKRYETLKEWSEKIQEIMTNESLTQEQRDKQTAETNEYYTKLMTQYGELYSIASQDNAEVVRDSWINANNDVYEVINTNTLDYQQTVNQSIASCMESYDEYYKKVEELGELVGDTADKTVEKTNAIILENNKVKESTQELIGVFNTELTKLEQLTVQALKYADALEAVILKAQEIEATKSDSDSSTTYSDIPTYSDSQNTGNIDFDYLYANELNAIGENGSLMDLLPIIYKDYKDDPEMLEAAKKWWTQKRNDKIKSQNMDKTEGAIHYGEESEDAWNNYVKAYEDNNFDYLYADEVKAAENGGSLTDLLSPLYNDYKNEPERLAAARAWWINKRDAKIKAANMDKSMYGMESDKLWDAYVAANGKKDIQAIVNEYKKNPAAFASGGYTGSWDSSGKLAILHQKELVLNQVDTKNILDAVGLVRDIADYIDLSVAAMQFKNGINFGYQEASPTEILQNVRITAEFPNVNDRYEIQQALNQMVTQASQFVNRKNF